MPQQLDTPLWRDFSYPVDADRVREPIAILDRRPEVICFDRFCVVLGARQVFSDGRPVELSSRAFDILVVLLRARGTIVPKDTIIKYVWPSTIVDESNLRFQMATLRKALGDARDLIKTVPGRGYLFVVGAGVPSTQSKEPLLT
jgi:DNA-binding winged helix-turn-helix (wHTH) protein